MENSEINELFKQGRYKEVIDYFSESSVRTPDEYNLLALSYYSLGLFKEARNALKNGLSIFPDDKDILFNLIEILYEQAEYEEAEKYLAMALKIEPENYVYYDILATILLRQERNEEALSAATNALKFAPVDVSRQLVEKYSNVWDEFKSKSKCSSNFRRARNILLVGSAYNYAYSFRKFIEKGWNLYVLKTPTWVSFQTNYRILEDVGAKIIAQEDMEDFLNDFGSELDVIVRTGYFYGGNDLYRMTCGLTDVDQIDTFFKVVKISRMKNPKVKAVLAFDGDSFFSDDRWNDWFRKRIDVCDYILFDTNNLANYFITRVFDKGSSQSSKVKVMRVEMPCSSDVMVHFYDTYVRKVLTMGRLVNNYIPISSLFIEKMKERISIGRGKNYDEVRDGLRKFAELYGSRAFGLGYFYDFYERAMSFSQLLENRVEDKATSNALNNTFPLVYGYTNVPGKVITYLQFGLIPIIPDDENDFHRELIDNGMAIGMTKDKLFFDPYVYSDRQITEMRRNIQGHTYVFTFDPFYDFAESIVSGK